MSFAFPRGSASLITVIVRSPPLVSSTRPNIFAKAPGLGNADTDAGPSSPGGGGSGASSGDSSGGEGLLDFLLNDAKTRTVVGLAVGFLAVVLASVICIVLYRVYCLPWWELYTEVPPTHRRGPSRAQKLHLSTLAPQSKKEMPKNGDSGAEEQYGSERTTESPEGGSLATPNKQKENCSRDHIHRRPRMPSSGNTRLQNIKNTTVTAVAFPSVLSAYAGDQKSWSHNGSSPNSNRKDCNSGERSGRLDAKLSDADRRSAKLLPSFPADPPQFPPPSSSHFHRVATDLAVRAGADVEADCDTASLPLLFASTGVITVPRGHKREFCATTTSMMWSTPGTPPLCNPPAVSFSGEGERTRGGRSGATVLCDDDSLDGTEMRNTSRHADEIDDGDISLHLHQPRQLQSPSSSSSLNVAGAFKSTRRLFLSNLTSNGQEKELVREGDAFSSARAMDQSASDSPFREHAIRLPSLHGASRSSSSLSLIFANSQAPAGLGAHTTTLNVEEESQRRGEYSTSGEESGDSSSVYESEEDGEETGATWDGLSATSFPFLPAAAAGTLRSFGSTVVEADEKGGDGGGADRKRAQKADRRHPQQRERTRLHRRSSRSVTFHIPVGGRAASEAFANRWQFTFRKLVGTTTHSTYNMSAIHALLTIPISLLLEDPLANDDLESSPLRYAKAMLRRDLLHSLLPSLFAQVEETEGRCDSKHSSGDAHTDVEDGAQRFCSFGDKGDCPSASMATLADAVVGVVELTRPKQSAKAGGEKKVLWKNKCDGTNASRKLSALSLHALGGSSAASSYYPVLHCGATRIGATESASFPPRSLHGDNNHNTDVAGCSRLDDTLFHGPHRLRAPNEPFPLTCDDGDMPEKLTASDVRELCPASCDTQSPPRSPPRQRGDNDINTLPSAPATESENGTGSVLAASASTMPHAQTPRAFGDGLDHTHSANKGNKSNHNSNTHSCNGGSNEDQRRHVQLTTTPLTGPVRLEKVGVSSPRALATNAEGSDATVTAHYSATHCVVVGEKRTDIVVEDAQSVPSHRKDELTPLSASVPMLTATKIATAMEGQPPPLSLPDQPLFASRRVQQQSQLCATTTTATTGAAATAQSDTNNSWSLAENSLPLSPPSGMMVGAAVSRLPSGSSFPLQSSAKAQRAHPCKHSHPRTAGSHPSSRQSSPTTVFSLSRQPGDGSGSFENALPSEASTHRYSNRSDNVNGRPQPPPHRPTAATTAAAAKSGGKANPQGQHRHQRHHLFHTVTGAQAMWAAVTLSKSGEQQSSGFRGGGSEAFGAPAAAYALPAGATLQNGWLHDISGAAQRQRTDSRHEAGKASSAFTSPNASCLFRQQRQLDTDEHHNGRVEEEDGAGQRSGRKRCPRSPRQREADGGEWPAAAARRTRSAAVTTSLSPSASLVSGNDADDDEDVVEGTRRSERGSGHKAPRKSAASATARLITTGDHRHHHQGVQQQTCDDQHLQREACEESRRPRA